MNADRIRIFDVGHYPKNQRVEDRVVVEEPMAIRVDGRPFAVLMRTPGDDRELVAGFLLTEGLITGLDDIRALDPCSDPNKEHAENTLLVNLAEGCSVHHSAADGGGRALWTGSSCGLCGKRTIEEIHQRVRPHDAPMPLSRAFMADVGERARRSQPLFDQTGGLHGAALFGPAPSYELLCSSEDVGRHNAVDKVIGRLVLNDRLPLHGAILWVSGRASYEMVQKALMAQMSALVCVGAPTSLAIELARSCNLTLVGFARSPERFNIYHGTLKA